jgi:hypothetical protein
VNADGNRLQYEGQCFTLREWSIDVLAVVTSAIRSLLIGFLADVFRQFYGKNVKLFESIFAAKPLLRHALCLTALLLAGVSRLSAQTPANKAKHPTGAPLPKLRTETAKTLAFKVSFSRWYQIPNGEPNHDQLNHVADYSVQLKRPIWLRLVDLTTTYDSRYIKDNKGSVHPMTGVDSYVGNEKQQLTWDTLNKYYTLYPPAHTLTDTGKNVNSPYIIFPNLIFTPNALTSLNFKADGSEVVNGKSVAVYRRFPPNQGETIMYVDPQTRLPVRISTFGIDGWTGDRVEEKRVDFSNWQFEVKFPPNTFDTTPPSGYITREELMKQLRERMKKQAAGK